MATDIKVPHRERISQTAAVMLIAAAVFVDGLQFFTKFLHLLPLIGNAIALLVGIFSSLIAGFTYWFWYRLNDIGLFDRAYAKGLVYAGMFLVEMIPLLNAVPGWTLSVMITIALVRREDRAYNEERRRAVEETARRERQDRS